ncbi:MAG: TetR/AcrR family transcriptional regulator, partial [bacterium]
MSPKQQLNQILEGGFDSVVDTGVRAFTVESLAKRLAMSKKTIYKFFPTKENLIRSIMRFVFTQIDAAFNKVMVDEPNPAVQFIKIMETIAKFAGRVPVDKIAELKSL